MISEFRATLANYFYLKTNQMVMHDTLHGFWDDQTEEFFLDLQTPERTFEPLKEDKILFKASFNLSEKSTNYYRKSYTFMDALGDLGGLLEALTVVCAFLVSPFYNNMQVYELFENIKPQNPDLKYIKISTLIKFQWYLSDTFGALAEGVFCCMDWFWFHKI